MAQSLKHLFIARLLFPSVCCLVCVSVASVVCGYVFVCAVRAMELCDVFLHVRLVFEVRVGP